jgi:hypothetical protein
MQSVSSLAPSLFTEIIQAFLDLQSVMGPADAALRLQFEKIIGGDPTMLRELTNSLNAAVTSDNEQTHARLVDSLINKVLKPSIKMGSEQVKDTQSKIQNEPEIAKIKLSLDGKGLGAATALRIHDTQTTFKTSTDLLTDLLTKMEKIENRIVKMDGIIDGIDVCSDDEGDARQQIYRNRIVQSHTARERTTSQREGNARPRSSTTWMKGLEE